MFRLGFEQRSGRVISLGRLILAALFLLAIWLDASQPVQAETETYVLLAAYVLAALAIAAVTWNDWWLDARLATPVHIIDVGIFTALVFSTEGYTSPFFLFFVFLLLSSAIRWSWRETAMTAVAVIVLYFAAGLVAAAFRPEDFELQRFIIRSGHLFILSAILIWFGVNQGYSGSIAARAAVTPPASDDPPLETLLVWAVQTSRARRGSLLWKDDGKASPVALTFRGGDMKVAAGAASLNRRSLEEGPFLYDLDRDRAVSRSPARRFVFCRASDWLAADRARALGLGEGLAVTFEAEQGKGELYLEDIDGLSVDHVEFGTQLSRELADHLRRHALLRASEESGEARARLSLARDLHDSVVQFLAGAAFRIEAMMRRARSGEAVEPELQEIKRLMLQEQDDLRSFIGALRSGREVGLPQLADELKSLAGKLSRQWDVDCSFTADVPQRLIPMRLNLDALQLVREAVANAVRHGRATSVRIHLAAEEETVRLELADNGSGFPAAMTLASGGSDLHPRSLSERVQDAGGELMLATLDHGTSLAITLPIRGRQ